ncbi:MAG: DUF2007 domain-containing protein [Flavobacteriales bacterium]|nr:DUF2007 domain-containing protein [Flavobacteriales bacterium]
MSEWVIVHSGNNPNLSEIIKSVLEDNAIEAVVINKMDSMHKHLMNGSIEVMVRAEDVINAKYIISKNELT